MARIPDVEVERLKQAVSLTRLSSRVGWRESTTNNDDAIPCGSVSP